MIRGRTRRWQKPAETDPLPNSSMASKVNLWTVSVEEFSLLWVVITETEGLEPFRCTATFSPSMSVRDCTKQF
jgi:hypothetical protein